MELNGLIGKRQKEDRKKKKERKEGIRTRQGFGELKTKMNCTEIFLLLLILYKLEGGAIFVNCHT